MKKQNRPQNIFWILSAVFAFGFFLALALPATALGAPTPPPGCTPHEELDYSRSDPSGNFSPPLRKVPGVYNCGDVPSASRKGVSISRGGQAGNCVAACTDKIAGGIVLNYGISSGEPYCFGAEKSQTCSVTVSDKRIQLDVKDSSIEQVIEQDVCDGFICTLVNLGTLLITFIPVSLVMTILWMLNWIVGTITALLGVLMKAVILATLSIPVVPGKLGGLDAIQKGWEFSRNFVNLLFLLFAVFTGLATILRLENYQAKRVLPMLLLMALLVNFSGVLVGVVVDFSNLLTKFFIERLGTWEGIKDVLSKVNDSALSQLKAFVKITSNPAAYLSGVTTPIAELMIMLIFFSLLLIALFVAMLVFVVRIAILWVLVIMAPFAFAAYALPGTRKFWNGWIQNLVAWSIVGIPLSFFLYIASFLVVSLSTNHVFEPKNIEDVGYPNLTAAITNILEPVAVLVVIVYGLIFSKKMAPAAAQGLINWGKTAAMGLATGGAALAGRAALTRTKAALATSPRWQNAMNRFATVRTPGTGRAGLRGVLTRVATNPFASITRWAGRSMGQGIIDSQKQTVGASDKSAAGKSMAMQASLFRSASNDAARIGIIQAMANDQNLDGAIAAGHVTPAEINQLFGSAAAYGTAGGLRNALPHTAATIPAITTPDAATIARAGTLGPTGAGLVSAQMLDVFQRIRPSNYKSMSSQVLRSPEFLNTLILAGTGSHLHEFIDRFGLAGRDEIQARLNALSGGGSTRTYLQTHNRPLANYINRGAGTGVGVTLT